MANRDLPPTDGQSRFGGLVQGLASDVSMLKRRPIGGDATSMDISNVTDPIAARVAVLENTPIMKISRTVDWTMPNGTLTQLFMEHTLFGRGGMINGGGGGVGSYVQVPVAGLYLAVNQISWAANATGDRAAYIWTNVQGFVAEHISQANTSGDGHLMQATAMVILAAGEQIAPWGYHRAGGGLVVDHTSSWFAVARIG